MEEYYTPQEVARKLKVAPHTVYRWIREGRLKGTKAVGVLRIAESEIQRFLDGENVAGSEEN